MAFIESILILETKLDEEADELRPAFERKRVKNLVLPYIRVQEVQKPVVPVSALDE